MRPTVPGTVCGAVLQLLELSVVSTLQRCGCGAVPGAELGRALLGDPPPARCWMQDGAGADAVCSWRSPKDVKCSRCVLSVPGSDLSSTRDAQSQPNCRQEEGVSVASTIPGCVGNCSMEAQPSPVGFRAEPHDCAAARAQGMPRTTLLRSAGSPGAIGSQEQDLHRPWERYRWAPGRPCHRLPGST